MGKRDVDVTLRGKDQLKPTLKGAGADVDSFGARIKGLLNPINLLKGGLASLGVLGFGALGKKAVESANESEAAWARVESAIEAAGITFRRVRGDLDDLFTSIQKTTRYSDDQAADAFAILMSITNDYTGSVKNLTLATNIAAAKKIDLETAAQLVGKAMIGETAALKKQGIVIGENADAIEELGKRFNGFAERDAATMQGQLRQVANAWDNVLEALGRAILGMGNASGTTNRLTTTLNGFATWIDENKADLTFIGDQLARILGLLGKIADMGILKPLAGVGRIATGNVDDDTVGGFLGRQMARLAGAPVDLEDAGSGEYYKALGRIRARSRRQAQEEARAAAAAAAESRYKAKYDAKDFAAVDKRLDEVSFDAARSGGIPRTGITGEIPGLRPATMADAGVSSSVVGGIIGDTQQLQEATKAIVDMGDEIDAVATGAMTNMADTWAEAVESIVTGSDKVGAAIGKAIRRGVGQAMIAQGRKNLLEAAAIAVEGMFNPVDWGRAAKLFGIGSAQIATGTLFAGGGGSGGSGGVGGAGFSSQQQEMQESRGKGTIIVRGSSVFDMSNPDYRDQLVDAINDLRQYRDIEIVVVP